MKEIVHVLEATLQQTKFVAGRSTTYSLEQLRALYRRDKKHGDVSAAWAIAEVPSEALGPLVEKLRVLLKDYLEPETDRIGNGLVGLLGGRPNPTVPDFSRILLRAAATLGTVRTTELLLEWIEGKPLRYHTKALLSRATVEQPLELKEGIIIAPAPHSPSELLAHLPPLTMYMRGYHDFMGGAIFSIPCEAEPALCAPTDNRPFFGQLDHSYARGRIPEFSLDDFCEAL